MRALCLSLLLLTGAGAAAETLTLLCYDELGRKSVMLTFAEGDSRVVVEESGDAFACAAEFAQYCTTSAGEVSATDSGWRFSWVRELTGERSVYDVNKSDLTYTAEYAGGVWASRCERRYEK